MRINCVLVVEVHHRASCSLIGSRDALLSIPLIAIIGLVYLQTQFTGLLLPTVVLVRHEAFPIVLIDDHGLLNGTLLSQSGIGWWHWLVNRIGRPLFETYSKIVIIVHIPCSTIYNADLRNPWWVGGSIFSTNILWSNRSLLEGCWRLHVLNRILLLIEFLLIFLIAALPCLVHSSSSSRQESSFG